MEIKDKVIIITGSSEGIGLETAKLLSKEGAKVVLAARSKEKIEELEAEIPNSLAVVTDMRKPADVVNLIAGTKKNFGRIDAIINNAGQALRGPIADIDIDDYKSIIELNVIGVVRAMQAIIPIFREQSGGTILNVSSDVSKRYIPNLGAYASTKYALNAISLTARQELEEEKIVVSVVHPTLSSTDFGRNAFRKKRFIHKKRPKIYLGRYFLAF
jgi:NADP-dependent 3-hydroxy acid dehydrogenase YdfG